MYALGPMYALSKKALAQVFNAAPRSNRFFAVEDQAMGVWMLAHDVKHFDDRRLCASGCHQAFVGTQYIWSDTITETPKLKHCHATPPSVLPFLVSLYPRFNKVIAAYEDNHD